MMQNLIIFFHSIAFSTLVCFATFANSQSAVLVESESRDASIAYIGSTNFVVGRVARDCLTLIDRTETPQIFVSAWQQRNAKYLAATQKYMVARFAETEASGGVEKRNAVISALNSAVRNSAEATATTWLDKPDKLEACKRATSLIDSGGFDISPNSPMFQELENLVAWAQR